MLSHYNTDHRSPRTLWEIYVSITRQIDHCIAMGRSYDGLELARVQAEQDYWDAIERKQAEMEHNNEYFK